MLTTGNAISNRGNSASQVTITGGTVTATTGIAILNGLGSTTIFGTDTLITSSNININEGTIRIDHTPGNHPSVLNVNSGKVENTSSDPNARAITAASGLGVAVNIHESSIITPAYP